MTKELGELIVKECKPEQFKCEVDIVFSGLDSDVAGETGTSPENKHQCRQRVELTSQQKWPS